MRPVIFLAFLFTLLPLSLMGKEMNISYRDNDTKIKFNDTVINVTGYQININLVKKKCNKLIFTSALKEMNFIAERVNSNIFHSKESVDNIVVVIENAKKENISPRTPLGKRILSFRSFLDKVKFQEDELCTSTPSPKN